MIGDKSILTRKGGKLENSESLSNRLKDSWTFNQNNKETQAQIR